MITQVTHTTLTRYRHYSLFSSLMPLTLPLPAISPALFHMLIFATPACRAASMIFIFFADIFAFAAISFFAELRFFHIAFF